MSSKPRWFDADTCKEIEQPAGNPEPLTYYPREAVKERSNEGPAEALLTTLLATWPCRGDADPLLIPGMHCRWMLISGTGSGDLRGYAAPRNGGPAIPVVVELKARTRSQMIRGDDSGVTLAPFKKALGQAIRGWSNMRKFYASEFANWGNVAPMPKDAILILAADRWAISEESMRTAISEKMFDPIDVREIRVVAVSRHKLGKKHLVCVDTQCVVSGTIKIEGQLPEHERVQISKTRLNT